MDAEVASADTGRLATNKHTVSLDAIDRSHSREDIARDAQIERNNTV
jgi:hypothetical protein